MSTLLAFFATSVVLIATPGPNLIHIVTRSVEYGRRAGYASAFGVETATVGFIAAAVFGLGSLATAWPTVFLAVRYAGAAYLAYLAVQAFRPARAAAATAPGGARHYWSGLLVNALNPKVVVFFVAFLPQFVTPGSGPNDARNQMLELGVLLFCLGLSLDLGAAALAGPLAARLSRPATPRRWPRHAIGCVYLALAGYAVASTIG